MSLLNYNTIIRVVWICHYITYFKIHQSCALWLAFKRSFITLIAVTVGLLLVFVICQDGGYESNRCCLRLQPRCQLRRSEQTHAPMDGWMDGWKDRL